MGLDAVVKEIEDEGEGKETRERISQFHQLQPQLCSWKPAMVSLSSLTPSTTEHRDLLLQLTPGSQPPTSDTSRHSLGTYQLSRPGKQEKHRHHTTCKYRKEMETKTKNPLNRDKSRSQHLSPLIIANADVETSV